MHGLNRVENENDIMHYQTSLQRMKDGFLAATAIIERVF